MTQNKEQKSNHPPVFDDVVIRLSRKTDDKERFLAQIRQTPIPLKGGDFQFEMSQQLEELHQLFTQQVTLSHFFYDYITPPDFSDQGVQQTADELAELAELHDKLVEVLPISLRLKRLIEEALQGGRGIRLIIEASANDQADRLLSLPWELLFLAKVELAHARRLLIVRRLLDAARHSPVEMTAPFNMVHVIADDPEQPIEPDLQQMERETIPPAITAGNYTEALNGSVEKLREALFEQPAQILHFLGHGGAPSQKENSFAARGHLCFVNEKGQREWVTGERLQHLLSGTPGLQLIVLNACDSASVVTTNMALDLVYSGFPYVVAMQAEMPQEAAKHFIRAFYSQLQQGQSIEHAVAAGRMEIASQLPGAIDWCLPVLYTNVGVAKKSRLSELSRKYQKIYLNYLPIILRILGGLHLAVGALLFFSGISQPLPDVHLIAWTIGWLLAVPPLLVAWVLKSRQLPALRSSWSYSTHAAFVMRLLISAVIPLAMSMIELFFVLMLLVGLGFWALLSPLAQVLVLVPFLVRAILLSYSQVLHHGVLFMTSVQIDPNTFDWSDLIMLVVFYIIILNPIIFLYFEEDLIAPLTFAPPQGNFIIGVLCLAFSYLIRREDLRKKKSDD